MPEYPITVPAFFRKLYENKPIGGLVHDVLDAFALYIKQNKVIFFRQYTDHGPDHIEAVLETASALITDESTDLFTSEDAAVLVIATVLHDAAMHLQGPGFIALVSDADAKPAIPELDKENWHTLWTRYVQETSRLSQGELMELFGVDEPIEAPEIENAESWSPIQHAYIGEFIRRYHHRLAHEMAIKGLPALASAETDFPPRSNDAEPKLNLAGLIARSHGTTIRCLLDYLSSKFQVREFHGTHTVYLMVLLRIADYLQLQSDRAPNQIFKVIGIKSPKSKVEWGVHNIVQDIVYDKNEDPEVVEVKINPKRTSIELFLRAQEWLHAIQFELDTSWAVLGEVFGRYQEKLLGLNIRRIRSNIDDVDTFGKEAGFVPCRVTFSAADAELLKLLIKPLYGDRPEIAVRELVQNAVDAVRERRALGLENDADRQPHVEVQIKKHEDGIWSLIIDDGGMGMTFDTLQRYFLNAGASFRSSMVWKKSFQDDSGRSVVLRSGRFGVGALAAFLVADDPRLVQLRVTTRHVLAEPERGLTFTASLTDRPLAIEHVVRDQPGTRVEVITTSPPAFMQQSNSEKQEESLAESWDWYCLDWPSIRRVSTIGQELPQSVKLPATVDTSPDDYHWLTPEDYLRVGWTYGDAPALVCNGIIIQREASGLPALESAPNISAGHGYKEPPSLAMPSLSVFDRDGKLPLTLDRLNVDYERISFLPEIKEDVYRNLAALLAVAAPSGPPNPRAMNVTPPEQLQSHPAIDSKSHGIGWVASPQGACVWDPTFMPRLKVDRVVWVNSDTDLRRIEKLMGQETQAFAVGGNSYWFGREKLGLKSLSRRGAFVDHSVVPEQDEHRLYQLAEILDSSPWQFAHNTSKRTVRRFTRALGERFGRKTQRELASHLRERLENLVLDFEQRSSFDNLARTRELQRSLMMDTQQPNHLRAAIEYYDQNADYLNRKDLLDDIEEIYMYGAIDLHEPTSRLDIGEAEEMFQRLTNSISTDPRKTSRIYRDVIDLIYRGIKRSSGKYCSRPVAQALMTVRSMQLQVQSKFEFEGSLSDPVVDLNSLDITGAGDGWEIVEYDARNAPSPSTPATILGQVWQQCIKLPVIPFDREQRRDALAHLYSDPAMSRHLQHWQRIFENVQASSKE